MKITGFHRFFQKLAALRFNSWWLSKLLYRIDPIIIKKSEGRNSLTTMLTGLPVVVLKSVGARSGVERATPLVGLFIDDRLILTASYFGSRSHPSWYYNIKANPDVTVEYQGVEREYSAREAEGEEREKLWGLASTYYPGYRNYRILAGDRIIPVVVLELKN